MPHLDNFVEIIAEDCPSSKILDAYVARQRDEQFFFWGGVNIFRLKFCSRNGGCMIFRLLLVWEFVLQAVAFIYKVDATSRIQVLGAQGLLEFMKAFDLKNEDLTLEFLPVRIFPYNGEKAASICTAPFAEGVLLQLKKVYWFACQQPAFQAALRCIFAHLGLLQGDDHLAIRVLNMRHNFQVSPLGVIHGGKGLFGWWEVPEKTTTLLFPGDRLIYFYPSTSEAFENCIQRLSSEELPGLANFWRF